MQSICSDFHTKHLKNFALTERFIYGPKLPFLNVFEFYDCNQVKNVKTKRNQKVS